MVKVHVIGDDVDVGMEDMVLSDHLLQHITNASREDQQRDLVFVQVVKKLFVAIPQHKHITYKPGVFMHFNVRNDRPTLLPATVFPEPLM